MASWYQPITNLFNRKPQVQPENPQTSSGSQPWPFRMIPSDLRLTQDEAMSVGTVWGAIRAIVDPIASSEICIFIEENGVKTEQEDNIDYLLNVRPNPDQTAQSFKEILLTQALVFGDGFAEIQRDNSGRAIALWPLDSERMVVRRRPAFGDDPGGLEYAYGQVQGDVVGLDASDCIHIRGPSVRGFLGDSAVLRAMSSIVLDRAQSTFATSYFSNGTVIGGVLKSPRPISPDNKKRFQQELAARNKGNKKAFGTLVLDNGEEWTQVEADAQKAQLTDSRKLSVEDIARYFGVPLVKLGVAASSQGYGTNVSQLALMFYRDTLKPWCNRLTEELVFKLYPARAPWREIEVDLGWTLQGTELERAQASKIWLETGVLNRNEVRDNEGYNSMGSIGDIYTVQTGVMELSEDNLSKPEPVAPAAPTGGAMPTDPAVEDPTVDPAAEDAIAPEAP